MKELSKYEKMNEIDKNELELEWYDDKDSNIRKFVRYITLNGYLLPSFLLKDKILYHEKGFGADKRAIFRFKKVLYYYEPKKMGYIVEHNEKAFFKEVFKFLSLSFRFAVKFNNLKKEYQESLPYLTSEKFWREVYSKKQKESIK